MFKMVDTFHTNCLEFLLCKYSPAGIVLVKVIWLIMTEATDRKSTNTSNFKFVCCCFFNMLFGISTCTSLA